MITGIRRRHSRDPATAAPIVAIAFGLDIGVGSMMCLNIIISLRNVQFNNSRSYVGAGMHFGLWGGQTSARLGGGGGGGGSALHQPAPMLIYLLLSYSFLGKKKLCTLRTFIIKTTFIVAV